MKSSMNIDTNSLVETIRKQNDLSKITFVASVSESVSEGFALYNRNSKVNHLDDFESVGFEHESKLLRSCFLLGKNMTRPCLKGEQCIGMQKKIFGWQNVDNNGIVLTEFMTPKEYNLLYKYGHYPKRRRLCVLCTRNMIFHCFSILSQKPVAERNVLINSYANICGVSDGYDQKFCILSQEKSSKANIDKFYERTWNGILGNVCMNHFDLYKFEKVSKDLEGEEAWFVDQSLLRFNQGKITWSRHDTEKILTDPFLYAQSEAAGKEITESASATRRDVDRLIILSKIDIVNKTNAFVVRLVENYALGIIKDLIEDKGIIVNWISRYENIAWYTFKTLCQDSISDCDMISRQVKRKNTPLEEMIHRVFRKFFDTSYNEKVICKAFKNIFTTYHHRDNVFRDLMRIFLIGSLGVGLNGRKKWRLILNLSKVISEERCNLDDLFKFILLNDNILAAFLERVVYTFFVSRTEEVPQGLQIYFERITNNQKNFNKILYEVTKNVASQSELIYIFKDFPPFQRISHASTNKRKICNTSMHLISKRIKLCSLKWAKKKSCSNKKTGDTFRSVSMTDIALEGHLSRWSIEGAMKILGGKDIFCEMSKLNRDSIMNMVHYFGRSEFFYRTLKIKLPHSFVKLQTKAVENRLKNIPVEFRDECIQEACSLKICPNCMRVKSFVREDLSKLDSTYHGLDGVKIDVFNPKDIRCVQRESCCQFSLESFSLLYPNEAGYIWCINGSCYMMSSCCGTIIKSSNLNFFEESKTGPMCELCTRNKKCEESRDSQMACSYCTRPFFRLNSNAYTPCVLTDSEGNKKTYFFCTKKHFKKTFRDHPEWTVDEACQHIRYQNRIYKY